MHDAELEALVMPELETLGFECVKVEVAGRGRNPIVRLFIDRPGGVSIKDCALVSRVIGLLLDKADPFPGRYLLEVSSPGSNRPLTKEWHFVRFEGHTARVQWVCSGEGKKTYTGSIRSCINGVLVLEAGGGTQTVRVSDIVKANLVGEEYEIGKKSKHVKRKQR